MAAPATCIISGTVYGGNGSALENVLVRVRVLPPVSQIGIGAEDESPISGIPQKAYTNSSGAFSFTVPREVRMRIEVPMAGLDLVATTPDAATAVLDDLSLTETPSALPPVALRAY